MAYISYYSTHINLLQMTFLLDHINYLIHIFFADFIALCLNHYSNQRLSTRLTDQDAALIAG